MKCYSYILCSLMIVAIFSCTTRSEDKVKSEMHYSIIPKGYPKKILQYENN